MSYQHLVSLGSLYLSYPRLIIISMGHYRLCKKINRRFMLTYFKQQLLSQWHMTWTNFSRLLLERQIASCWYKSNPICQFQAHFLIEMRVRWLPKESLTVLTQVEKNTVVSRLSLSWNFLKYLVWNRCVSCKILF